MTASTGELHLSDYLDIASRRKWIIVAFLFLSLGAAVGASALQTPLYRAEARVQVDASGSTSIVEEGTNLSSNVRSRNLQNEVEFARSDRVETRAEELFGGPIDATVAAANDSDTLTFKATSSDPDLAARSSNAFAQAYVSERSLASGERFIAAVDVINKRLAAISEERLELQDDLAAATDESSIQIQLDSLASEEVRLRANLNEIDVLSQLNGSTTVALLNAADRPDSAFAPSWVRNIALALVAGLILGVGGALILETLDDTILHKRDLEAAADGLPVLGLIPPPAKGRFGGRPERKLVTSRTGSFTESFRTLRSAIELGQVNGDHVRSILITSANPAEGKSTVAAHLAVSFARSGARVLVIDADMHNPSQHMLFGIGNANGLADELAHIGNAEIITEQVSGEGLLSVIPSGVSGSSPAELLRSIDAQEFFEKISYAYDLLIIDSPPLRPVADTLSLARIADATLLVAMRGRTNAAEIREAMELLARAQARPLGAILSGAEEADAGYGYGYGTRRA